MNVYFEEVKFYHYPLIKYYLLRKFNICIFDFRVTTRKIRWLRKLVDNGRILKVSPYVIGNDNLALDNVDKVYNFIAKKSRLINIMIKLYGEEKITLAYKKTLVKELSKFYAIQITLDVEGKKILDDEKIVLIPYEYLEISKILNRCNGFSYKLENIFVPSWSGAMNTIDRYFAKLNNWTRCSFSNFCSMGLILLKIPRSSYKKDVCEYQYAIPITNPGFQFRFKEHRTFDFLLDGTNIRRDNTIFLFLSDHDEAITVRLTHDHYNVIDFQKKRLFRSPEFGFRKNTGPILKKTFIYTLQNLFLFFFEEQFIVLCSQILVNTYLQWTLILNNLRFSHYITFNDEDINHIGRNILLNKYKIKTWYYAHSSGLEGMHTTKDMDMVKRRHWLWSFLFYDYYIGWNSRMIEFYKLHHQEIKNYYNVGCIWSEFIGNSDIDRNLESYFKKYNIKRKEVKEKAKVLSFFDTSFFDGVTSKYPLKDGIKFYNDILRLLSEVLDLFIIVKEKKPETIYSNKSSHLYSQDNREYSRILKELRDYPRCYVAGYNVDPLTIINLSDLTITYAFSSSTIEALGARKKAIFYDPIDRFKGYYYDEIPDFVAHGYEELKYLINKLLYEVTDTEYGEYLNREILNKVEDYLDGKGLTRFRNLLSKT